MKSVKILFIEDDDLLRSLFSEALTLDTERAYTILSALDLKSGKAILQSTQPDIIVLDLILPYDEAANQNHVYAQYNFGNFKGVGKCGDHRSIEN